MSHDHKAEGVTISELMITVVIISILSSVAVSSYQDYVNKSEVAQALNYASRAKIAVTKYYQARGVFPANSTQIGLNNLKQNPSDINALSISKGGIITITTSIDDKMGRLSLTPTVTTNGINWSCEALSLDSKYLPSPCRKIDSPTTNALLYNTVAGRNMFINTNEVSTFFGGQPKIDGVNTPIQWFLYSNVAKMTEADLAGSIASGSFHLSDTLSKQDGTIVADLNQFCDVGYRGVIFYDASPSNAGLTCISE